MKCSVNIPINQNPEIVNAKNVIYTGVSLINIGSTTNSRLDSILQKIDAAISISSLPPVSGNAGKYLTNNGSYTFWKKPAFTELSDVPASYTGQAGKVVFVKDDETGLDFIELTISNIYGLQSTLDDKVDKIAGKGLSTNDYTNSEKTKLSGIEDGAQVNLIEHIKKNGTELPITGKSVDIPVPIKTSDLTNDGEDGVHPFITLQDVPQGTFTTDTTVSLSGGKLWLGRYPTGTVVQTAGKTYQQVLQTAAVEPINPTVNLSSPTTIQFNQTSISNVLNFSYTINSLGASVQSVLLEWRRNNTGSWTILSTNTSLTTYTHNLTDSAFNTQPFNYRYTVTDTAGGTFTQTLNITPQSYVAPSITFSAPAVSLTSPESNTVREQGNLNSTLQGSTSRNSTYVPISSYKFQLSVDGGAWSDLDTQSLSPSGGSFTNFSSNGGGNANANQIQFRVAVTDSYTTTYSYYTINFKLLIFYGPSFSAPTDSTSVRALPNRQFYDAGSPFILNTGTSYVNFSVCMPNTNSLTQVLDLDALNANITANYVQSNFNVNNAGGSAKSYKNYTMTNAVVYSPQHRHQISYV